MSESKTLQSIPELAGLSAIVGLGESSQLGLQTIKSASTQMMNLIFGNISTVNSLTDLPGGIYSYNGSETLPNGTYMKYGMILQIGSYPKDRAQIIFCYSNQIVAYRYIASSGNIGVWTLLN